MDDGTILNTQPEQDFSEVISEPFSFSLKNNSLRTAERFKGPSRPMKKAIIPKDPNLLSLEELLAVSELRYKTELKRLKHVIGKNKRLSILLIISFLIRTKDLVTTTHRQMFKIYMARWKANIHVPKDLVTQRKFARVLKIWRQKIRHKLAYSFFSFRENGISLAYNRFESSSVIVERNNVILQEKEKEKRSFKKTIKLKNQPRNKNVEKAMGKAYYR